MVIHGDVTRVQLRIDDGISVGIMCKLYKCESIVETGIRNEEIGKGKSRQDMKE